MISRLLHQGFPSLQAQKCVSTANTSPSTIVIGTTLVIVWPSISTISTGRLDMAAASLEQLTQGVRFAAKGAVKRAAARVRSLYFVRRKTQHNASLET